MVHIDITYQGSLRCEAVHAPSGTKIVSDAPVDHCGKGESFSPTDMVATALGTCMVTVMGIVAERNGWELDGATASVDKKMVADPRRVGEVEIVIAVPRELDSSARETLESAARTCPVAETLGERVNQNVRFVWGA